MDTRGSLGFEIGTALKPGQHFYKGNHGTVVKNSRVFSEKINFKGFLVQGFFSARQRRKNFGVLSSSFTFDSLRISAIPFNNMIERNNPERYNFPIFRFLDFGFHTFQTFSEPLYHFQNRCTIFKTIEPFSKPLYRFQNPCTVFKTVVLFSKPLYCFQNRCAIFKTVELKSKTIV